MPQCCASNNCENAINGFMNMNNGVNNKQKNNGRNQLVAALIAVLLFAIVNLLIGPFLWNEIMRKLVPSLKKARWFDTVGLYILFSLILQ